MTKRLINYLTIIAFVIPFTLLIVDSGVLFPFITTKALLFRSLVSLSFVFIVWLYLINPGSFPKNNYLFLAIVLFLIANILSTVFSVTPYRSFWGNAERMEGLWSMFFYLGYLFLLLTIFQFSPERRKIIFISILIVTTLISLIQINQAFFQGNVRPSATLGNATYIGFVNLLMIFLILFFFADSRNLSEKAIYLLLIFVNFISLLGSQTRGSILGLLTGIIFALFFYGLFIKVKTSKKILFFALGFLIILSFYFFLKTDFALKIIGINRLAETLKNPVSVFPRIFAWKIFLDAFKEKPIFGWGQESLPIAFFSHFDPRLYLYEKAIFDRPHNKFIEVLVSTGIVGFMTWVLIFVAFVYYLIKQNFNLYQKSILFGSLFAYLGQVFSLFDMQASYLIFFFILSLVTPKVEAKEDREKFIRPYLVLVSGIVLILIVIHLQHYYVVRNIIKALIGVNPNTGNFDSNYSSFEFKRISNIAGPFLTEEAIMIGNYLSGSINKINNLGDFLNLFEVIDKAYQKDHLDFRLANIYIGNLYIWIEIQKQLGQNYNLTLAKIEKIFNDLINAYPLVPETYAQYAFFLAQTKNLNSALAILEKGEGKIAYLYPKYFLQESLVLLDLGEEKLAYEKLNKFKATNTSLLDINDYQIMLKVYLANQDVENSKLLISQWLKLDNLSSTKELIIKILSKYNQAKILNLDI
ncbi:MAG: hypothetical protein KatS3mg093_195 [Candidatus Parcubacteria bacterium]|nr:MAG: hypothetical protein KatS3mg093_195 [Candidatus Parcubacteria bacterium]